MSSSHFEFASFRKPCTTVLRPWLWGTLWSIIHD